VGGVSIKMDTSEVDALSQKVVKKLGKTPVLQKGVDVIQQSVKYNFMVGGRPKKWAPLKYRVGEPLRDRGILMNSISGQVMGDKGFVTTNVIYAAVHNYGARKGQFGTKNVRVRSHTRRRGGKSYAVGAHSRKQQTPFGDIRKREFMVVQPADITTIENWMKVQVED